MNNVDVDDDDDDDDDDDHDDDDDDDIDIDDDYHNYDDKTRSELQSAVVLTVNRTREVHFLFSRKLR